jgi:tetratricopeptide (TPR) repeat protein
VSTDIARQKYAAGRAFYDAGNLPGAERMLKEALAADPQYSAAHALLSFTLAGRGQLRAALHVADDGVAAGPSAFAFRAKAMALRKLKRHGAAVEAARAAVQQGPEDEFSAEALGLALEGAGRFREAEAAYRRAVELAPGDDRLRADLGRFLLRRKDLAGAERVAAEIDQSADFATVLLLRGEIALRRHRSEEARDFALWLLSQDAANPAGLRLLTQVKASQSVWLALWWHYALFMATKPLWLRVAAFVPGLLLLAALLGPAMLLAIIYLRVAPLVFARMLRRELQTVKLRKSF